MNTQTNTEPEQSQEPYRIQSHRDFLIKNGKGDTIAHCQTYRNNGARWLTDVWVDPEHRRKGLATRLVLEALEDCKGDTVYLDTHAYTNQPLDNGQLAAYYARFGFKPTDVPGIMKRSWLEDHL